MSHSLRIPLQLLGQSGAKLSFRNATVYIDPYLSNSVQDLEDQSLERQVPIAFAPETVTDADWVLITHDHLDHCDPHTLPKLATVSPSARFMGPFPVLQKLKEWGIAEERLVMAQEIWFDLSESLRVRAIPAAHPEIERDSDGNLSCVGYLIDYLDKRIYIAGDTFVRQEIINTLNKEGPVHTALLPVNEHNFFRGRAGIIGNMTVREAFQFASEIGVRQVVAIHWDMFANNSVAPDEIRLIYKHMTRDFALLLKPEVLNLSDAQISVVIRTLNEAVHLEDLLLGIAAQQTNGLFHEVVLVDSGSTDGTLEIAEKHGCNIHHISREEFSFGRSLNRGCEAATGDILVITSGHCIPVDPHWLQRLSQPILEGVAEYTYGRQFGGPETYYSESRIFAKYFPEQSQVPQKGYFCNNANSALSRTTWEKFRFDEELTGLEDMELAKRLVADGGKVAYVADAGVYHYHSENWAQVKRRFEREAIALQQIMPHIHMQHHDLLRYITTSIWKDWQKAWQQNEWRRHASNIAKYRYFQYSGSFKGNRDHRKLSHREKEKYFFPD